MQLLLEDKGLTKLNVIRHSQMDRHYAYHIFSGVRANPSRNKILALAAYNAGRGTVWHWIEEYSWNKDFDDVNAIPYGETRDYVKRVIKSCDKYKAIDEGGRQHER